MNIGLILVELVILNKLKVNILGYLMKKHFVIIPARGGSKRLSKKIY